MKARFAQSLINGTESGLNRIIILSGARQTGKTTLAKNCFPGYTYLSIEDPVLRVEYSKLTASQWKSNYPLAILDEIQKMPQLIETVKAVYDLFGEPRYILLGSSQILFLQKIRESLAGRCIIHQLYPLTIPEILTQSWEKPPSPSLLQQVISAGVVPDVLPNFRLHPGYAEKEAAYRYYLQFGGYPALVSDEMSEHDRYTWLTNYVRTYLERDIRDLAELNSLEPFTRLQQTASLLTGQLVNFSSIARECSISPKTAQRFLQYLEISFQAILLQSWQRNPLKRLVKSHKLHFLDPGIQKAVLRKQGRLTGQEFESAIIAEIYKQLRAIDLPLFFYHLRTTDGREADLLVETESGYYAFEVKMAERINTGEASKFKAIADMLDKPLLHSFILSNDVNVYRPAGNVLCLPAGMMLS